jgi:endonuclease III
MAGKVSVRKTRRLRPLLGKQYPLPEPPEPQQSLMEDVMMAVLWDGAEPARAKLAFVNLTQEFADWNELRVSLTSEVAAILEACGVQGEKAAVMKRILGKAVEDFYCFDFERLHELSREKLRAWFLDLEGLPHHLLAAVLYEVYRYDRVLVDEDIARVFARLGLVSETATPPDIEAALARVVPAREARLLHHALRQHAVAVCTKTDTDCPACILRGDCVRGKVRIAEIAAAKKAAEAAARAKARADKAAARLKAKAERAAKRKAAAAARRKAKPKRAPRKKGKK